MMEGHALGDRQQAIVFCRSSGCRPDTESFCRPPQQERIAG
jgi:hypothetical protein